MKDDDAKDWNADDLLKELSRWAPKKRTRSAPRWVCPALEILSWAEKPAYDAATHRLVWAMSSKERGAINHRRPGRQLQHLRTGPRRVFSLNLLTDLRAAQAQDARIDDACVAGVRQRQTATQTSMHRPIASLDPGLPHWWQSAPERSSVLRGRLCLLHNKFAKVGLLALAALIRGLFKLFGGKKKAAAAETRSLRAQVADPSQRPQFSISAARQCKRHSTSGPPDKNSGNGHCGWRALRNVADNQTA